MLHGVINHICQVGGECALGLLLVASIVSMAIISDRVAFFLRHRIDVDQFARQLLQLVGLGQWSKARTVAGRSSSSVCHVLAAGLTQVERGRHAARVAMRCARLREQHRLEGQVGLLAALGQAALMLGLLGTVCDFVQVSAELNSFAMLGPTAGGLLVAIPALLAARLLKNHVRRTLGQIDSLTLLVLLQMEPQRRRRVKPISDKSQAA